MGEDPSREGLLETPKRVVKAFKEYFGEDSRNIVDQLIDKGIIEKKPVKGGIMIYIKGEGPKFKEPDDALSKILGD